MGRWLLAQNPTQEGCASWPMACSYLSASVLTHHQSEIAEMCLSWVRRVNNQDGSPMERTENASTQLEVKHPMVLGTFPISVSIVPSLRCRGTGRCSTMSTGKRFGGPEDLVTLQLPQAVFYSVSSVCFSPVRRDYRYPELALLANLAVSLSGLIE